MHIHIESDNGEAKFWIEPVVAIRLQWLKQKELNELQKLVE